MQPSILQSNLIAHKFGSEPLPFMKCQNVNFVTVTNTLIERCPPQHALSTIFTGMLRENGRVFCVEMNKSIIATIL